MKVILDTNVLISAFLFHGRLGAIVDLIEQRRITLCFTPSTLEELSDVLHRPKFSQSLEELSSHPDDVLDAILSSGQVFSDQKVESGVVRDPDDTKFLSCATSCNASFIVSGDKHLLEIKKYHGVPIVKPDKFLEFMKRC